MSIERLAFQSVVPVPREFAWHCYIQPGMFDRLAPPWQDVRTLYSSGTVEPGDMRTIELCFGSIRLRWVAVHEEYREEHLFTDRQVKGPFGHWRHQHRFVDDGECACRIRDELEFALPAAPVTHPFGVGIARTEFRRMFMYRHFTTFHDFVEHYRHCDRPRRSVTVSGEPSEVVSQLRSFLSVGGHEAEADTATPDGDRITVSGDYERGLVADIVRSPGAGASGARVASARIVQPGAPLVRLAQACQFFDLEDVPVAQRWIEWSTIDDFVVAVQKSLLDPDAPEISRVRHLTPVRFAGLVDALAGDSDRSRLVRPPNALIRRIDDVLDSNREEPNGEGMPVRPHPSRFASIRDAVLTLTGNR